ncbi:protein PTCD3 homolog, mitochondrial [Condylostylus longicornis]|uniref:protein PTCD3 homolog, mitochondrial n=1 Tax=Condylostylus longicornis TaxID=2530218 RepID=UPI00244E56B3|nr:protein PTCD3 homolog, mitochondrial [Condylostylus longicornis]
MFLFRKSVSFATTSYSKISLSGNTRVRYLKISPSCHENSAANKKISIPNRIKRSSTAILEALASTVGDDPTAAHYKYHDDPFLIPTSNLTKKTYAMAQESGRKAARWIREEHRDLFMHKNADPPIPAFFPKMIFTEESEVDEQCLRNLVNNCETNDAIFVYKLMKTKNIEISNEMKQAVLELVCFCNNEDLQSDEFLEEYWLKQESLQKERSRRTWKDGDIAEQIFKEIEPKTSETYSAIIRGMCKYYQAERGYALFQEALEKQIQLDTKTFNAIISVANLLKDTADLKWELVKDILKQMSEHNLKPNLYTLNATLATISSIGNLRIARNSALKTLSEFKKLGIEPCLATWYYVLIIFCRERGPVSHVIVDILNEIQHKEFTIQDPKDTYFFATAMDVCRNHLHDKILAKRVNELLHVGNNYDLIGDPNKESIYYRHYFALLCQTEPLEEFMKIYDLLVPNVYIPEPGIMSEILKALDVNGGLQYIPKIWSDMVIFDHINRESLVTMILKMMVENKPNPEDVSQQNLTEKFGEIAMDIFTKIEEQSENAKIKKSDFTGKLLGDILKLLSDSNRWEDAQKVFKKLDKNQHLIPGTPSSESIESYLDLCIKEKKPSEAINCLEYGAENGFDSSKIAKKIRNSFTLSENHQRKVSRILDEESSDDE